MPTTKIQGQGSKSTNSPFWPWPAPQGVPVPPSQDTGPCFSSAQCHQSLPQRCCGSAALSLSLPHHSHAWRGPCWFGPFPGLSSDLSCQYRAAQRSRVWLWPWLFSPDPILSQTCGWTSQPYPWTCLTTVNLPGGVAWRLKLAVFSKPVLLPWLGCWLVRSLVQGLCYCTPVPLFQGAAGTWRSPTFASLP